MENWLEFTLTAQKYGVDMIKLNYSGGGDSGQIDDIEYRDSCGKVMIIEDNPLNGYLEDFVNDKVLDDVEDWYNNSGGYGEVIIDVKTGDITVNNTIYIQDTEDYEHTFNALELDKENL